MEQGDLPLEDEEGEIYSDGRDIAKWKFDGIKEETGATGKKFIEFVYTWKEVNPPIWREQERFRIILIDPHKPKNWGIFIDTWDMEDGEFDEHDKLNHYELSSYASENDSRPVITPDVIINLVRDFTPVGERNQDILDHIRNVITPYIPGH